MPSESFDANINGIRLHGTIEFGTEDRNRAFKLLEKMGVITKEALIRSLPHIEVDFLEPELFGGYYRDHFYASGDRGEFIHQGMDNNSPVPLVTEYALTRALGHYDRTLHSVGSAWGNLQSHFLQGHSFAAEGACDCGMKAYHFGEEGNMQVAVDLVGLEDFLRSPDKMQASGIRGFVTPEAQTPRLLATYLNQVMRKPVWEQVGYVSKLANVRSGQI